MLLPSHYCATKIKLSISVRTCKKKKPSNGCQRFITSNTVVHLNMLIFIKPSQRICRYLYFLHEFANFLNRGLFDFQQFGLLKKFLLHVYKLALQFLQSLPPLFAQPKSRSNTARSLTPGLKSIKATLQTYLAWLVSFFAD